MNVGVIHGSYEFCKADVEAYEIRLDLIPYNYTKLKKLCEALERPFILTPRMHIDKLDELLLLRPDYIDFEFDKVPAREFGKTKIIGSYHDFAKTPDDLPALLSKMQRDSIDIYKIATYANSTLDALRMAEFVYSSKLQLVGLCMGEHGYISRILGPRIGSYFSYTVFERGVTPGEILFDEFPTITKETSFYALLGDPVTQSPSHITHNRFFQENNFDAHYVKLQTPPDDLRPSMELLKKLPFKGLSITAPHKNRFGPDPINSFVKEKGEWEGFNTDGKGAIDVLEPVHSKEIAILGKGGAALAIYNEAKSRGALPRMYGREEVPLQYDILINATPSLNAMPLSSILANKIVMDIILDPLETPLLIEAKARGNKVINGLAMFRAQADYQFKRWLAADL